MTKKLLGKTDEQVEDIVGAMADAGITYDDVNGLLSSPNEVTYNQSTSPTSPSAGETWYDTSSGIFRVYADLGSGLAWHSIPPVQVLEEASTFSESDVTVTDTDTMVGYNNIKLFEGDVEKSAPPMPYTDTQTGYAGGNRGVAINPNTELVGLNVKVSDYNSVDTDVFVHDSAGNKLAGPYYTRVGNTRTINVTLQPGETYFVTGDDQGNQNYDPGTKTGLSYPYTSTAMDITSYAEGEPPSKMTSSTDLYVIDEVQPIVYEEKLSGSATVEWDSAVPTDIQSYDLATFQRTLDNETVTIDVEDGNGNVLFSDIGQNFDISTVDTSKEVKLRANLSRTNTANNPTVDYLARRFTR